MSRIGKLPIKIADSVKVDIKDNFITVEGKRGKLSQEINSSIRVKIEDNNIIVERAFNDKQTRAFHGLYRSLIFNMVKGVSDGFSKNKVIVYF
ncbi:LSU ribosomal protein L6P [Borrelia duttonii CR2A]|uniref:50S ribosomal protein L6 n=1 Tax=Borrelia duttonii CR2A TaxID=1432657 RepID=W6TIZ7_9SPIR|nr:LSU ribosomal protein L6P [Borrelia duttonii CR2A]